VRQLAMKGHGSALYAAGSDAYLGHILCIVQPYRILLRLDIAACARDQDHWLACGLRPCGACFLLIFVFPSAALSRYPRAPLAMNERAARHEVTLGTAEGSQGEGETRKKSLT